MNKKYSAVIEWIIAVVLLLLCYRFSIFSAGHFSALNAHKLSEKTMHYGPSKIIKEIDLKNRKVLLCKYKDWISADVVERNFIRWYPGSPVSPRPIDYTKKVTYSWSASGVSDNRDSLLTVIGYANDPTITKIILEAKKQKSSTIETQTYKLDESHMFIFNLTDKKDMYFFTDIKAVDKDGKVIYEEKTPQ